MDQIQTLLDEMEDLNGVNQQLQDTIEENEQRLRALEKRQEQIGSKDRIFQVMKMKMLADKINPAGFEQFEFVLPKEALTLATEEALERGLLTKLEIGTR
jgi:FtsZ-binding cell division protein ZapB